jgi:hypothetical protein
MEDIVAVEVTTDTGAVTYFLTWGRIQDPVDPEPLESLIMSVVGKFKTPGSAVSARVCGSLQEASSAPHFFESYFGFCQQPIPFGRGYGRWRSKMDNLMRGGREIAGVGPFG